MNFRLSSKRSLIGLRAYLCRGGIIAYPTESCYGIGALPTHSRAIRKIIHLKKRPQNKGLIVIGKDVAQLQKMLFRLPESVFGQLNAIYPAPKTFLLSARKTVLPNLRGSRRSQLAIRVPDFESARRLCDVAQSPLVSTSCNRAGKRACRSEREVRRQFGRQVWVIGGRIGNRKQPSEIIDWTTQERLR